jgi:dipeptidyl aminopeptidase/acylaminoacyl peptidase
MLDLQRKPGGRGWDNDEPQVMKPSSRDPKSEGSGVSLLRWRNLSSPGADPFSDFGFRISFGPRRFGFRILALRLSLVLAYTAFGGEEPQSKPALAVEVHSRGWIAFSAQTPHSDWDLFLMRPDGSERRALTDTREFNEAGARFSPDGKRLLYYRMARSEAVDNNTYGTFDLVLADANGSNVVVYGRDFPWASWSPDGRQIACLAPKGIQIVDVASRQVVRTLPRQGMVQQLVWSPDGKAFTGTANGLGAYWNIGRLADGVGKINPVSETERYNCTPDWHPDSRHILYARGIIPKQEGGAQLWMASEDGRERTLLYAEEGRHIYGACPSPDAKYLIFTRSIEDLGAVGNSQTTMAVVRWADTPMLGDESAALRQQLPEAKPARRLDLGPGWEPHWTYGEASANR